MLVIRGREGAAPDEGMAAPQCTTQTKLGGQRQCSPGLPAAPGLDSGVSAKGLVSMQATAALRAAVLRPLHADAGRLTFILIAGPRTQRLSTLAAVAAAVAAERLLPEETDA